MSLKKKVVWLPYDMDTAIGINNDGELVFDYQLEDIDYQRSGAPIFNGQDSVIWKNIRAAFGDELKTMYQNLRSSGALSYDKVEQMFEEHQSKWSEAIFNEDSQFKYIEPFIKDNANYLYMLLGSKEEQRKWWLYNRFRYIDSKYIAGDARNDSIFLRPYAAADITLTPYADIYATIAWDATITQERATRNQNVTLICPYQTMNGNIVTIYSSSQLALIGDLSPLQIGQIDISNATRLQALKVGDASIGYDNSNLYSMTFGSNRLLKVVDVRNCSGLGDTSLQGHTQTTVDLSGCEIIEEVYFDGTKIQGVTLPNGGVLRTLSLPSTITSLVVRNQNKIQTFAVENNDYSNITTLRIENCSSAIPVLDILSEIPANSRVRLIGFTTSVNSTTEVEEFYDYLDTMRGLDESGGNVDTAQVSGTITGLDSITGNWLAQMNARYPFITITYNHITSNLFYYNGETLYHTETIQDGGNGTYSGTPTKAQDAQYTYTFAGWSKDSDDNTVDSDALVNVVADRRVYACYTGTIRTYTATFVRATADGGGTLYTQNNVPYGTTPTYSGSTPTTTKGSSPDFTFNGWNPALAGITGNTTYTAVFKDNTSKTRGVIQRTITNASSDIATSIGGSAFYNCSNLTTADFPVATSIGTNAFYNCSKLTTADFPVATSIGTYAFYNCSNLTTADFPVATSIGGSAFQGCSKLTTADFPVATSIGTYAFYNCSKLTTADFPVATSIGTYAFQGCSNLTTADFPVATSIGTYAFYNCSKLTTLILRANQVATLSNTSAFTFANIVIIYVPDDLVSSYQSATNWSTYASRIKGISELPAT